MPVEVPLPAREEKDSHVSETLGFDGSGGSAGFGSFYKRSYWQDRTEYVGSVGREHFATGTTGSGLLGHRDDSVSLVSRQNAVQA